MTRFGLICSGVLLGGLASTAAQACSCMAATAEDMVRQGYPVANIVITNIETTDRAYGPLAMTADVVRSFTGTLPQEISLRTEAHSAACGVPVSVGEAMTVVLHPSPASEKEAYTINLCTWMPVTDDDARAVLEQFADLRAAGEGVWIDVVAFQQLLATHPHPDELRGAFPEVLVVLPGEIATREYRYDQSRFFALLDDSGLVYGGEFQ